MTSVPFTIRADLDLGGRIDPYLCEVAPDVIIEQGLVPDNLGKTATRWSSYEVDKGRFLLNFPNGLRFYIENGNTIRYERPSSLTNREVLLFLLGTAWGALAYQRNLLPMHASGLYHDGDVYAFTGISGAGKSTLTTALSSRGHKFFSDDILIIDPKKLGTGHSCYAGQKDLKLWDDALELTGSKGKSFVRDDESFTKYYADPSQYSDKTVGRLKALYLLSPQNQAEDEDFVLTPITGALAIKRLSVGIYRYGFGVDIIGQKQMFLWMSQLMAHTKIYGFKRPFDKTRFDEGVDFIAKHLPDPSQARSI